MNAFYIKRSWKIMQNTLGILTGKKFSHTSRNLTTQKAYPVSPSKVMKLNIIELEHYQSIINHLSIITNHHIISY